MKVTVPKNKGIEEFLEGIYYQKVGEDEKSVTYEGISSFFLSFEGHDVPKGKRKKFMESVKVEGGFKVRESEGIGITPVRNKKITFRISEDEYQLLKEYAEAEETTVSALVRWRIFDEIQSWSVSEEKREKARKRREKEGLVMYG